ncbi:PAS-domain containing protein [Vreelandella aquamarina]|uniref:hybrid sensor histidine kinase/response regulator n=1 Tax=Vreelandella aquamarina TaxID=77097 RepID=UPI00384D7947
MATELESFQAREIQRLKRINAALIERVELSSLPRSAPYAAFEHTALLAEQVRERTQTLNQTLHELRVSNRLLGEARGRAEDANQTLIDAIESLTDAFVLFDAQGYIAIFNSHFAVFWKSAGIKIKSGMHIKNLHQMARDAGLIISETSEGPNQPTIYHLHDGRWVQVHQRQTRDGGKVILYIDITAIKRQENAQREKALAEKSQLLQATLNSLSQGVAVIDADSQLEMCNQRFITLAGIETPCMPCNLASLSEVSPLIEREDALGVTQPCERRLPDGRIVEVRGHSMPPHGQVLTFTDVTERIQYAQTLLERERWIRNMTDELPAMIAYLNKDLRYVFANRVYERWYGWPRGMLLGEDMQKLHSPEHCRRLIPYLERVMAGETVSFELAEADANGDERVLLRAYVPHYCNDTSDTHYHGKETSEEVIGVFVLIRDITERRRTTEALQHAYQNLEKRVRERTAELTQLNHQLREEITERTLVEQRLREAKTEAEAANISKSKFLAAVSHDLLQPLNAAQLFAGALEEVFMPDQGRELTASLARSLKDVESLLGTLVDMSRLDAGVISPELSSFSIADLLDNLAREYHQMASSEGLSLRYVRSSAMVKTDSALLGRVIRNFLSNAVRYTPRGRLLLGCRKRPNGLEVQVGDTGVGINSHECKAIFQEFRRLDVSGRSDRGLGLGLSIADRISRILGCPLQVISQPGKGSLFSILLPYARCTSSAFPPAALLPTSLPAHDRLTGQRIWVVDNDLDICLGMHTLLSRWNCQPVVATSEAELARQVDLVNDEVDALIVDYHLDQSDNGIELARRLNARRNVPVPVMTVTANYSNELRQRVRELGYQLVHKPVKPLKLRMALSQLTSTVLQPE